MSARASMPEARQNNSKLAEMFASASSFSALVGMAVDVVGLFMALLSFRGISTPSLPAQGEQRRSSYFNIDRDNSQFAAMNLLPLRVMPTNNQRGRIVDGSTQPSLQFRRKL